MGKHAAPRTSPLRGRATQRVAAVSAGAFVLCLGAAAPALATTGVPTPPPVPQPVSDAVQTVADIAGVPNPLGTGSTTTKPRHHHHGLHANNPNVSFGATTTVSRPSRPTASKPTATYAPASYSLAGLRGVPTMRVAALDGRVPTVASKQQPARIANAASIRAGAIPLVPPTQDTTRILLVAVAVMALGGLTSGHLKLAQQRLATW
jgi:hypothetical protein